MEERVQISIIMPIYNCAGDLDVSINSILQQSFSDYELLLIDDGSTDNSFEICEKYRRADARVRAFHTENQGVSGARNYGIKHARGEYLYFVDADDRLLPDALQALLQPMSEDETVDIVIAYYDGTDTDVNKGDMSKGKYAIRDVLEHILRNAPTFYYGVCWNKLYRASVIEQNDLKFPLGVIWSEDMLFNMSYLKFCKTVYYTDRVVYYYNRNEGGGKLHNGEFSLEKLSYKLEMEKLRINVLEELLQCHEKESELLGFVQMFAVNRMNQCFTEIFRISGLSRKERKALLRELVRKSEVKKILSGYDSKAGRFIVSLYVWLVMKDHYNLLYCVCRLRFGLQDNRKWRKVTDRLWPKFSL